MSRLSTRSILAFAEVDWDDIWYSRHQILHRLSKTCPVIVVGPAAEARAVLRGRAPEWSSGLRLTHGLWSYRPPPWLPVMYRPRLAASLLQALRAWHLEATLRKLRVPDPIYYVWHPEFWPVVSALRRRFTIYHRYDKFDAYEGVHKARLQSLEREVGVRADLLIASSRAMATDLSDLTGRPVTHLPHGVDLEYFLSRTAPSVIPADLADVAAPRLGFVGRLNEAVDELLLSRIALLRPDWSLVLIGPECHRMAVRREQFERLKSLPNVHVLGLKKRDVVPKYIAGLDVGLLCYKVQNWTGWGQPIKAYEYLACGRPMVCAPIAAAQDFGDLVRIAETPEEWVSAIDECLRVEAPELARRRVEFARANSWERRVEELTHAIQDALIRTGEASP